MKNLAILLFLTLFSCPSESFPEYRWELVNNSNGLIHVVWGIIPKKEYIYIDDKTGEGTFLGPYDILQKNDKVIDGIDSISFKENKNLWIIVYKQSTLDSYTWEEIRDQGLFDQRYDLTLEDLREMDFKIMYTVEEDESLD